MTSTLAYIREQTSSMEDNKNIGYEVHNTSDPARFYLTFKAVLQSFGVENRNKRYYEASNVMDSIENSDFIQDQLRKNCWMGEYDHPAEQVVGERLTVQRIANPDPKHTSHYIRKPWLEGNLLKAPIQTDSATEDGMNLAIKIVDGKIVPGFSARVLGDLQSRNGKPTVIIKKMITYDAVLYPSHPEAVGVINQPIITESVNELEALSNSTIIFLPDLAKMAANNSKDTEWLCESFGLTINDVIGLNDKGSILIKENRNLYLQPISDKIIQKKTINALRDYLNK